jgi:cyclopropane-fatty-acyl-phospholipid synthase
LAIGGGESDGVQRERRSVTEYRKAAQAVLETLFGELYLQGFGVELWDGSRYPSRDGERFTLQVHEPGALRLAFTPPVDLGAGRAFASGVIDVDGDVEHAVDTLYRAAASMGVARKLALLRHLRRLPKLEPGDLREASLHGRVHSRKRDRAAIGFHYDQPIAFYRSFLDREMVYSCGYYDDGTDTLEAAQTAKLDYICKKLRLRPGERLLDIGCGWGAFVLRAAQQFGARALGITLSRPQYEEAQRRIAAANLGDRVQVELRDYRDLRGEQFDKIASIGMFEHVGRARLAEYFRAAYAALRPGGLFLNHGIAEQGEKRRGGRASGFIERFVFPDGELVAVSDALLTAERAGFEVRDVESLREHYARTLRAWVANLERNRAAAEAAAGAQSYRTWRLYMAGSAQGFATGRLGIFQSLLARPEPGGNVRIPATRRDLYCR